ncbi:hypothetical protein CLU79DRAFT_891676 [Phycomyces nitens]|nr:hypothetical protein CLU79DRAFT_891676 [Phycomyces nitens]
MTPVFQTFPMTSTFRRLKSPWLSMHLSLITPRLLSAFAQLLTTHLKSIQYIYLLHCRHCTDRQLLQGSICFALYIIKISNSTNLLGRNILFFKKKERTKTHSFFFSGSILLPIPNKYTISC